MAKKKKGSKEISSHLKPLLALTKKELVLLIQEKNNQLWWAYRGYGREEDKEPPEGGPKGPEG